MDEWDLLCEADVNRRHAESGDPNNPTGMSGMGLEWPTLQQAAVGPVSYFFDSDKPITTAWEYYFGKGKTETTEKEAKKNRERQVALQLQQAVEQAQKAGSTAVKKEQSIVDALVADNGGNGFQTQTQEAFKDCVIKYPFNEAKSTACFQKFIAAQNKKKTGTKKAPTKPAPKAGPESDVMDWLPWAALGGIGLLAFGAALRR